MAIKDQCLKCRNFGGEYCKHPSTTFVFDQNSCIYYEKSSINLKKEDKEEYEARRRAALASDVAPSAATHQPQPAPQQPQPAPQQPQPAPQQPSPYQPQPAPAAPPAYETSVPVTPVDVTPAAPAPQPAAPAQRAPRAPRTPRAGGRSTKPASKTSNAQAPATKMFENAFSFNGRIKRLEYGISFFISYVGIGISTAFDDLAFFVMIAACWFWLAQLVKRCHDVGHSAWWLLIPYYFIYLFFAEGDIDDNEYGPASLV